MKSKSNGIISLLLAYILIALTIYFFKDNVFIFSGKNLFYTIFVIIFYVFSLIIPLRILKFNFEIKNAVQNFEFTLNDFTLNAEKNNSVFCKIWLSYKKTFIENDNRLELNGKTRTNADLYFNADELCEARFHLPHLALFKIISGTFVGLGILGTFIGFSEAIPSTEISSVSELNPLFDGLHTAFNTSIIGVFSSIIYNFLVIQPLLQSLNENSKKLSDRLDEQFFVSDVDAMEKLGIIFDSTLSAIKESTKELAEKFQESSSEIFKEAISEGRDAINAELKNAALSLSEITKILQETPAALAALNDELNASILESTKQTKIQLETVVDTINTNLNDKFQNFANELTPASEKLKQSAELISEIPEKIQKSTESLAILPEKIQEIHKAFSENQSYIEQKLSETTTALRDAISAMGNSYETILEAIRRTLDKIQQTKGEIDAVLESSKANEQEISKNLQGAINQYNQLQSETKNMLSGFREVDKSLAAIFDQIKNQFETYSNGIAKNLTTFMDRFAEGTKSYTDGFTASSDEIRTILSDMESLQSKIQSSEQMLADLPDKMAGVFSAYASKDEGKESSPEENR